MDKGMYLVNDPQAVEALVSLQLDAGMRARFGDPERYASMGERLSELHSVVKQNASRVVALAKDETRTEVTKHGIAKDLAERSTQAIQKVAVEIRAKVENLQYRGHAMAEEAFAPRSGYSQVESETRQWIREQVKTPEGMAKVSELAKKDATVASIIYHSPNYLVGINEATHKRMQVDAIERFVPKAYEAINESIELERLVGRYEKSVSDIHRSFYTPSLADKVATRVAIE
jgi:hypothetical protein